MLTLPELRVGVPVRHEALTVFPLFDQATGNIDYLLSDEALAAGVVSDTVKEVGETGSVPTLVVNNQADSLVLFLEGEELHGAKQNRVLNTSVLVGARTKTPIPVSCVEQGRWRFTSAFFGHGNAARVRWGEPSDAKKVADMLTPQASTPSGRCCSHSQPSFLAYRNTTAPFT